MSARAKAGASNAEGGNNAHVRGGGVRDAADKLAAGLNKIPGAANFDRRGVTFELPERQLRQWISWLR